MQYMRYCAFRTIFRPAHNLNGRRLVTRLSPYNQDAFVVFYCDVIRSHLLGSSQLVAVAAR